MTKQINDNMLKKTILVVDDTSDNLSLILDLLKDKYRVKLVNSGKKAIDYLKSSESVDLILLDIMMPELSGYDVIKILKKDSKTKDIPIIFLTALSDMRDEQKGLEMGAADYITKPISAPIMHSRIKTQLENKQAKDFLKDKNSYLENEVDKRTQEISLIQDVTILTLASLAETRDADTGNHIRRTQHYMLILAKALKNHPKFQDYLSDEMIEILYRSAPLHDIGKVGIADKILLKPGTLTSEEFVIMKEHTNLGKNAIENAEKELGVEVEFLKVAKEIAYSHHENYDGSGFGGGGGGFSNFGGGFGGGGFSQQQQQPNLDIETNVTIPFSVSILGGSHSVSVNGERFDIKIPAGVKSAEKMRVKGKGHAQGGRAGDLFLKITVASNPEYIREGDDLVKTFDVPLFAALFGEKISIKTLEKEIKLKVPSNTKNGQRFRVKEMGAMNRKTKVRGNLYLEANIVLPKVEDLDESLVEVMKEKLPKE